MRRCKPGMRARIIKGSNAGKIVVVVRRYSGEEVSGATWVPMFLPWVVTSASGPLRSCYHPGEEEAPPSLTIVTEDRDLEPLPDNDEDEHTGDEKKRSKPRETVVASKV